jgi:N-acetylglucosamine kinase-like BadF-type ATPase
MYVLGVDGGGTKTYCVITDVDGNLAGSGMSGCGNHQMIGISGAIHHIRESIDQALHEAGLGYTDIACAQYGLAGADRMIDLRILEPALSTIPLQNWALVCDTMEGLRIGSKDNIGVVLVCGSGTNAAGRNRSGMIVQTGGFGDLFGDRTGGIELAKQAFSAAVRSWEEREIATLLTTRIPETLGFANMPSLVDHYLDHGIAEAPHQLSILLNECANDGDMLSIRILHNAGKELGLSAISVIRRLGGFDGGMVPIVLVGSVIQKGRNPVLLQALEQTISTQYSHFQLIIPNMAPVYGSILLALDRLGLHAPQHLYDKFVEYGGNHK